MKPSAPRALLLLSLLAAAVPARAAAQPRDAWVLPRGLLELDVGGTFTHFDGRLGGGALGDPLVPAFQAIAGRLGDDFVRNAQTEFRTFLDATDDPEPGAPDSLFAGTPYFRLRADTRLVPVALRYGLTSRVTVSVTVPFERHGVSAAGPLLLGGNVGVNPAVAQNQAALEPLGLEAFGGAVLLPLRDSPEGREVQSRLAALEDGDTLVLPTDPVTFASLLERFDAGSPLTAEEAAALGLASGRAGYTLGDVEVGVRYLLRRGPAGWPDPDSAGTGLRASVGLRARLPTGMQDTVFLAQVPFTTGHAGVGGDVAGEMYLSSRWSVRAAGSADVLFPADVQRLAFTGARPFPADSALRTVRSEPGARIAAVVSPRWRLTRDMSFHADYAFAWRGETRYAGPEGLVASPLEATDAWTAHAVGVGGAFSTLNAYAAGETDWPFEVSLTYRNALFGTGGAPDAGQVRLSARIYVRPAMLRRGPAPAPAPAPSDEPVPDADPPAPEQP